MDLIDFSELAQNWGLSAPSPHVLMPYNLSDDETIDVEDLGLFCENYLQPRVLGAWWILLIFLSLLHNGCG